MALARRRDRRRHRRRSASQRLVRVEYNKIYAGAPRRDGYAGSISVSPEYLWRVPRWQRPLIAHNLIALLETPVNVCIGARLVDNTILRGKDCPEP